MLSGQYVKPTSSKERLALTARIEQTLDDQQPTMNRVFRWVLYHDLIKSEDRERARQAKETYRALMNENPSWLHT